MSPRNCARLTLGRLPLRLGLTGGRQREHKPLLEPGGGIDGRARRCGRRPGRLLALRRSLDARAREHGRNVRRRDVPGRRPGAAARARRIELLRDSRGIGRHPGGRRRSLDLEARRFLRRDIVPARRAAGGRHRGSRRAALSGSSGPRAGTIPGRPPTSHVPPTSGRGPQGPDDDQVVELTERPFPPGRYPLILVGSGPGALQLTYCLRRLGIDHAVLSDDPRPGGMFCRWPIFQRMLSWTKPYAEYERGTPAYERYDWNSLLAEE